MKRERWTSGGSATATQSLRFPVSSSEWVWMELDTQVMTGNYNFFLFLHLANLTLYLWLFRIWIYILQFWETFFSEFWVYILLFWPIMTLHLAILTFFNFADITRFSLFLAILFFSELQKLNSEFLIFLTVLFFFSIITPVFSVTWSSEIILIC